VFLQRAEKPLVGSRSGFYPGQNHDIEVSRILAVVVTETFPNDSLYPVSPDGTPVCVSGHRHPEAGNPKAVFTRQDLETRV